jgi:hypothetical protein
VDKIFSRSSLASVAVKRAQVMFGRDPMFTFQPDDGSDFESYCSIRLHQGAGESWFGLVEDKALFTDRIRMGNRPKFVVHYNAETPTVCGEAEVSIVGRVASSQMLKSLSGADQNAATELINTQIFGFRDAVLIQVKPVDVRIDEGESPVHGAIPRT